jgi:hypothetical protein
MEHQLSTLLNIFKRTEGLVMPPIQLYASYLAISAPPYNTGLFDEMQNQAVIRLDQLHQRCITAARSVGMIVPEEIENNAGMLSLDVPQVCSILASALGDLRLRHGNRRKNEISQWAHEVFDDILPVLNDDIRVKAAAEYRTGTQDLPGKHDRAFKARVDSNVLTLESPELINVSDFLLKRIEILAEDAKCYTKKWNEFEP